MEKKCYLTLDNEFLQYCKLNNIDDVEKLAKETFKKGFDILKYGIAPPIHVSPLTTEQLVVVLDKLNKEVPPSQVIETNRGIINANEKDIYGE